MRKRLTQFAVTAAILINAPVVWADRPAPATLGQAVTAQALQDPGARRRAVALVRQANKKLVGGYYAEALVLFQKAYRVYPSPKLHFNLAQTYGALARPLRSLIHYERFLKRVAKGADTKRWVIAHQEIFKLLGQIATLQLQVNVPGASVYLDGKHIGTTPIKRALRLTANRHAVVVTKPGYERQVINLHTRAGQNITHRAKLLTEAQALAKRRLVRELQAKRRATQKRLYRARAKNRLRRLKTRRALTISGWTAVGLGLAAGLAAGVLGGLFERERRALESAEDQAWLDGYSDRLARADRYKVAFYTGLGVGGALLVAGTVLAIVGSLMRVPHQESPPKAVPAVTITPVLGPASAGATLQLQF